MLENINSFLMAKKTLESPYVSDEERKGIISLCLKRLDSLSSQIKREKRELNNQSQLVPELEEHDL